MAARSILSALDTRSFTIEPVAIDDEGVLQRVLDEVDGQLGAPTAQINLDLQTAADTVIRVVAGLRADAPLYDHYKLLAAAGMTDFTALERLNRHAPALWFAAYRYKLEREAPGRVVTEAALTRYTDLRDHLAFVLGYHFGGDAAEGPRLRAITRGRDHLVLANNLRYLAELAIARAAELAHDRKLDPAQAQEALAASAELRAALGAKEVPGVRWLDRAAVLWTLVQRDFGELTEVGRFLLRARPEEARRRFPSLVRTGGARGPRVTDAENDDAEEPADATKPAQGATAEATKPAQGEAAEAATKTAEGATADAATKAAEATKPAAKKVKATKPAAKKKATKAAKRR